MNNIKSVFKDQMIKTELSQSRKHGLKIAIPFRSVSEIEGSESHFHEFYNIISSIKIYWELPTENPNSYAEFKTNPWIIENYINNGYSETIIHQMLSGFINIQKLEDILNPEFCKDQGYYYQLKNSDSHNPDEFLPFDICSGMTACLKKEDGKILDNVWLVITEDVDDALFDMKVSIEEYLNLAYKAKCFEHWQAIYLWKEDYDRYELMKRFLPKMVPHIELDLSDFGM